jgi:Cytochrome c oxidase subunit IV
MNEIRIFAGFTVMLTIMGVVYGVWSRGEGAGTAMLILSGVCTGIIGGYLAVMARASSRSAEQTTTRTNEAGDDHYLPHASVWPLELGAGMTLSMVGLMLGRPILVVGALVALHALWGWARQSRRRT